MIKILEVTKRYGKLKALDNLLADINDCEATALWGSNGAGKTTLIRCLLGVTPFEGEIFINNKNLRNDNKEIKKSIGFVPQEISLHDNLLVSETLNFYSQLKKTTTDSIGKWTEILGIDVFRDKLIKELSGGMRQKLALAIALLGNPLILLLDEPTANLDLRSREDFIHLLGLLKSEGKTIIFSSHRMEEVMSFADRVLVLDNGKIIADASPMSIYKKFGRNGILKIFIQPKSYETAINLLSLHGFTSSMNGKGIKVKVDPDLKIEPIKLLLNSGLEIENFDYEVELF
ncbi:MAG TPA: ABC transporter ATP-binding protein [Ignavibacteriaceae bacterium]|nr:ABC transporter ATP-binding protein [Ignavibacteriaceae bacterium]